MGDPEHGGVQGCKHSSACTSSNAIAGPGVAADAAGLALALIAAIGIRCAGTVVYHALSLRSSVMFLTAAPKLGLMMTPDCSMKRDAASE